jgi:hypothetical protein
MNGTKIYGCLAAQNEDLAGETISIKDLDLTKARVLIDEHRENPTFFHTLGAITKAKKLFSEKDCEDAYQLKSWKRVGVPMVYIEGVLADGSSEHPNAKAAAELLKFVNSLPDSNLNIGLSVDGSILERKNAAGQVTENKAEGRVISKALAVAAALTVKPCNPKCFVSLMNDLQKSTWVGEPPALYYEALKKSQAHASIFDSPQLKVLYKLDTLKKSVGEFLNGFATAQCTGCGKPVRFFKSTSDIPNKCGHCGEAFSISNLWKAIKG